MDTEGEILINMLGSTSKRPSIISQQQVLSTAKDHEDTLARKGDQAKVDVDAFFLKNTITQEISGNTEESYLVQGAIENVTE